MPVSARSSASPALTARRSARTSPRPRPRGKFPGAATDPAGQLPPPRPPTPTAVGSSSCEPHRAFIEAQLRLRRNAIAIYQDLVDNQGFAGAYNAVKRFAAKLRRREPEQFDRLSFVPGEEMQVDYGEGALTRVPGSERYRPAKAFRSDAAPFPPPLPPLRLELWPGDVGAIARTGLAALRW